MGSESVAATLPGRPASVGTARRLVRDLLLTAGLEELVDSAQLLVSELVGNVVLHVGGDVRLRATVDLDVLVVEVGDDSPVTPQLRAFSDTASTGRGMRLVHSLSAEHGMRLDDLGKTVWVRLTLATVRRDESELADGFSDVDWLAELDAP